MAQRVGDGEAASFDVAGRHIPRLRNLFLITSGTHYGAGMQRIEIDHDFSLPVERLYAYLSEHENLGPLFGAKIARVRDGDSERNGTGSVRQLRVGILPPFC